MSRFINGKLKSNSESDSETELRSVTEWLTKLKCSSEADSE